MAKIETPCKKLESLVLVSFEGDILTAVATTAQPPGTRVCFELEDTPLATRREVRGKVVTVARRATGGVVLGIKLSETSKSCRDALAAAIASR